MMGFSQAEVTGATAAGLGRHGYATPRARAASQPRGRSTTASIAHGLRIAAQDHAEDTEAAMQNSKERMALPRKKKQAAKTPPPLPTMHGGGRGGEMGRHGHAPQVCTH